MIRSFTTSNGISFQVDNLDREGWESKARPFCLFKFDGDFDSVCHFIGNYESFDDAFDFASKMPAEGE